MKKNSLFILFLLIAHLAIGQQKILVDKIVGMIGNQPVLFSEIEEQYSLMLKRQSSLPENSRCVIIDQLLTQELLVVQGELDSLVVTDEEVEAQLNSRIDQIMRYMNGDVSQFIAYYGKTPDEVKEEFRPDLRDQILAQRMQQQILGSVKITPSEVIKFFDQIPKDSLPYFNSEIEVGEIVLKPEPNKKQRQIAIDTLTEVRRRILEEEADFAKLASYYSQDPGSGSRGGDLGWTKRGDFVPEFEAAAYNLEKMGISDIVKSDFGYHLIQLLDRKGNQIHTRHILIKPEITQEDIDAAELKLDSIRMLVATDSLTFNQAVTRFSDEKAQSKTNAGVLVNPKTGNGFWEVGDLPVEIYFTIDTMEVGQISSPVEFENIQSGEIQFKAILLMSRTEPHIANLKEDYSKIQTAALEQKKQNYLNDWVKMTRDKTYVKIDKLFMDCEILDKWINKKDTKAKPH